jgi:MFS family permease
MKKAKSNLHLIAFESVITSCILSVAIMTPFFHSIGMDQKQISLSQIIFTVAIIALGIPGGYIADRFSRKWANVIGDFGCALSLVLYSTVQSFVGVVVCEILFGIFLSISQGVDATLIKHFSSQIDPSGKLFKTATAKVASAQHVCALILILLGGPIGAICFRLAIALSAITYFAGGVITLFIKDDSENFKQQYSNPFKDMFSIITGAVKNPALRLRICAYAVTREATHGLIWVFTPLLLLAGVPLAVVSLGWALNSIAACFGAEIARRLVHRLREWQIVAIPIILITFSLSVMSLHFSIVTVWLYLLMGAVQGWTSATMMPLVQQHVKPSEQTSIVAFAKLIARLIYIPAVWTIGVAADIKLEYSLLATLLIFVPLSIPILIKLKKE